MPQVSIIVPVYNVEKYLGQCLDSLVNQTFGDIEIICMDDGSTDQSGDILEEYASKDGRVKVFHKENTGYGNTMNTGLDQASGEYIAIVESDDFVNTDMIAKMYQALSMNEADIVKAMHYDYRGGKDYLCDLIHEFPKNQVINSVEYPCLVKLAHTIWSCMYRKKFLDENHIRFHETKGASYQDISFAIQCWIKANSVYFMEDAFLHYRNDNPNSSMHNPNKVFCVFEEYGWLEEMFENYWREHSEIAKSFVCQKYTDYFNHYHRVAMQYQYAFLLRFSEELEKDFAKKRLAENCYLPAIWTSLCEIHTDVNQFFLKSAKKVQDLRLEICSFGNEEGYKKGFFDVISTYPELYIYGAGKVGQKLAKALIHYNIHINAFVVTEKKSDFPEFGDIPVVELYKIKESAETSAIIIAVTERNQYELYQNLIKYEFKHIFRVDDIVRQMLG